MRLNPRAVLLLSAVVGAGGLLALLAEPPGLPEVVGGVMLAGLAAALLVHSEKASGRDDPHRSLAILCANLVAAYVLGLVAPSQQVRGWALGYALATAGLTAAGAVRLRGRR